MRLKRFSSEVRESQLAPEGTEAARREAVKRDAVFSSCFLPFPHSPRSGIPDTSARIGKKDCTARLYLRYLNK